jgi:Mg2+-importing ATPase
MLTHATEPESGSPGAVLPARRSLRWFPWLFGIALLAAVIVAALHFAEAREFAHIAEHAQPWWLSLAILFQAATYIAAGQVFRGVAQAGGHTLSLATACRFSLTKLFVDQAVPSAGLSGTVVLANGLQQRGIPRSVVAAGVVVDLASYYAAYVLSLGVALSVQGPGAPGARAHPPKTPRSADCDPPLTTRADPVT